MCVIAYQRGPSERSAHESIVSLYSRHNDVLLVLLFLLTSPTPQTDTSLSTAVNNSQRHERERERETYPNRLMRRWRYWSMMMDEDEREMAARASNETNAPSFHCLTCSFLLR